MKHQTAIAANPKTRTPTAAQRATIRDVFRGPAAGNVFSRAVRTISQKPQAASVAAQKLTLAKPNLTIIGNNSSGVEV